MLAWKRRRVWKMKRTSLRRKGVGDFEADTVLAERRKEREVKSLKYHSLQTREVKTRDDSVPASGHKTNVILICHRLLHFQQQYTSWV